MAVSDLPEPDFADDPDDFAFCDLECHTGQRADGADRHAEIVHGQHWPRGKTVGQRFQSGAHDPRNLSRISSARISSSPNRLTMMTVIATTTPGKMMTHGARKSCAVPELIIAPQLGVGGCAPRPKKPERRLQHDAVADGQHRHHDDRRDGVGHEVLEQDVNRRRAEIDGRLDERLPLQPHDLRPRQPCELGEIGDGDGEHRGGQAGAEDRHEDERDENVGKRPGQIDHRHDHALEQAAEIASRGSQCHARQHRDADGRRADRKRCARAVDDAGQHIAAEFVRAHPVREAWACVGIGEVLRSHIVGRDPRGEYGRENEEDQKSARNHAEAGRHGSTGPRLGEGRQPRPCKARHANSQRSHFVASLTRGSIAACARSPISVPSMTASASISRQPCTTG